MFDVETQYVPDRQHHVDFSPYTYTLKKEILEFKSEADKNPKAKEALHLINNAHTVCDLGCGSGNSSRAIVEMCPELESIYMVDGKSVISDDIVEEISEEGIKVTVKRQTQAQGFLQEAIPESLDMIFWGNVINNDIEAADIQNMSKALKDKGIVFETDQTLLDRGEMMKLFEPLYESHLNRSGLKDIIWKKRTPPKSS
jgi:cystathionine beta-lyase/cystathionine gamma-synthase